MREKRIAQLLGNLPEKAQAFLATNPVSLHYLSGFRGDIGMLLLSPQVRLLAVDPRYTEQALQEASDFTIREVKEPWPELLASLTKELALTSIAFEAEHVTILQLKRWQERLGGQAELIPAEGLVPSLRAAKDFQELERIRAAVALADEAMAALRSWLRPGVTEKETAWFLESFIRTHGAESVAFPLIVASGPNAALPHARPSDKLIREGEPIIVDIGATIEGYCSDLTRTFVLGQADERFSTIFEVVFEAQVSAEKAAQAGMPCRELDSIARSLIEQRGYGPLFGHGLGHGVGLEIHERPSISAHSQDVLAAGNVVTIEPGIYLPGWGGVRIEDLVLVTEDGIEVLTQSTKEPWL